MNVGRVANSALLGGPSTSPLESATETHREIHEELEAGAEDPSLEAAGARAGGVQSRQRHSRLPLRLPYLRLRLTLCLRFA